MRASLLKALTVFSPRGNALIEGRVKVDGQGSAMTQQRRGQAVERVQQSVHLQMTACPWLMGKQGRKATTT